MDESVLEKEKQTARTYWGDRKYRINYRSIHIHEPLTYSQKFYQMLEAKKIQLYNLIHPNGKLNIMHSNIVTCQLDDVQLHKNGNGYVLKHEPNKTHFFKCNNVWGLNKTRQNYYCNHVIVNGRCHFDDNGKLVRGQGTFVQQVNTNLDADIIKNVVGSLPTITVSKRADQRNEECAECQKNYTDKELMVKLPCNHHFHKQCVESWLAQRGTCPLCKYKITQNDNSPKMSPHHFYNPKTESMDGFLISVPRISTTVNRSTASNDAKVP